MSTRDPKTIRVGPRCRTDVGNLNDLCRSISTHGLLHPIVIDDTDNLIAGYRRLQAWKKVHRGKPIPVSVMNLQDPLGAEMDENTQRLDLSPSEKLAVAQRIEEAARLEPRKFQKPPKGEGRPWIAARAVGWSRPTLNKARLIDAVAHGEAPSVGAKAGDMHLFAEITPGLKNKALRIQADLDEHGHVDRAYEELRAEADQQAEHQLPPSRVPIVAGRRSGKPTDNSAPTEDEVGDLFTLVYQWNVVASLIPEKLAPILTMEQKDILRRAVPEMRDWLAQLLTTISP
jgi:hypothetical protein